MRHCSVAVYLMRPLAVGGYNCDVKCSYPGYVLLTKDPLSLLRLCCIHRNNYVIIRKMCMYPTFYLYRFEIYTRLGAIYSCFLLEYCTSAQMQMRAHILTQYQSIYMPFIISILSNTRIYTRRIPSLHSAMYIITCTHTNSIYS